MVIIPWRNHHAGGGGEVAVLMPSSSTVENDNGRAFEISDGMEDDCHNEPRMSSGGNDAPSLLLSHLDHQSSEDGISSSPGLLPKDGADDGIAPTTTTTLTWTIFLFLILKGLLDNSGHGP